MRPFLWEGGLVAVNRTMGELFFITLFIIFFHGRVFHYISMKEGDQWWVVPYTLHAIFDGFL